MIFGSAKESSARENPFTPKVSLVRYWSKQINIKFPISPFLLSKASPLNAVNSATFVKLAAQNGGLSSHLSAFCSSANLLCFPDLSSNLHSQTHDKNSKFTVYSNQNFTNYGTSQADGSQSFKKYSESENSAMDSFRRYSRNSQDGRDKFSIYAHHANVADDNFNTYGTGATGGEGEFKKYNVDVNFQNLRFTSYGNDGENRAHKFSTYVENANVGVEWFTSYGKNGDRSPNEFDGYDEGVNLAESNFTNYGNNENGGNDTFKSYGSRGNQPSSSFQSYGEGGKGGIESFTGYSERSSVGTDAFKSYGKNSHAEKINFTSYFGQSFAFGDNFTGYGQGADEKSTVGFSTYGEGDGQRNFKEYAKGGASFVKYNVTRVPPGATENLAKKLVEPGKFFREAMLQKGTLMPMPDIRDKMPKRSFLPRSITSKLPFSTAKISELKEIFHASDSSSMETMLLDALKECERAPSRGETKRCVGSAEDLIDFATSVLGHNAVVRTIENVNGWKQDIELGTVKGINGGKVTKSVSCHQSLYPYLLYYCHSVPKVRVYEADILDPNSKARINHGVAVCHLDTSAWSSTHGAFLALGSGPGEIEVCHWIFENDMTWTIADE